MPFTIGEIIFFVSEGALGKALASGVVVLADQQLSLSCCDCGGGQEVVEYFKPDYLGIMIYFSILMFHLGAIPCLILYRFYILTLYYLCLIAVQVCMQAVQIMYACQEEEVYWYDNKYFN